MQLLDFSMCRVRHSGTFADRFASAWFTGRNGSRVRIVELWALSLRLQALLGQAERSPTGNESATDGPQCGARYTCGHEPSITHAKNPGMPDKTIPMASHARPMRFRTTPSVCKSSMSRHSSRSALARESCSAFTAESRAAASSFIFAASCLISCA